MSGIQQLDEGFLLKLGSVSNYLKRVEGQEDARTQMLAKRAFLHRPLMTYTEYSDLELGIVNYPPAMTSLIDTINTEITNINNHRDDLLCEYEFLRRTMSKIDAMFRNQPSVASPPAEENQGSL